MLQNVRQNKKMTGLVLIGVAAFAYYRYSKMTAEEKDHLVETITSTGKKILGQVMKGESKNPVADMAADNIPAM